MRKIAGDIVRKELKRLNLIYFDDLLKEARIAIDRMDNDVRAALAIAIAERVLKVKGGSMTTDMTNAVWEANEIISIAWKTLQNRKDAELSIKLNLLSKNLLEGEWADDDGVAAAIYAARATVTGDAESLIYEISRLLDTVFSSVYSDDFFENCAHPVVQSELIRIRLMLSMSAKGNSIEILEKLRKLPDSVG
jgi:hypothetical protein